MHARHKTVGGNAGVLFDSEHAARPATEGVYNVPKGVADQPAEWFAQRAVTGNQLKFVDKAGPGDFIFVPPYVPHQEINARPDEAVETVVVRSGQEPVVVNLEIESPEARNLSPDGSTRRRHESAVIQRAAAAVYPGGRLLPGCPPVVPRLTVSPATFGGRGTPQSGSAVPAEPDTE